MPPQILIVVTTFCLSCVMALIMCICIELPTSALYKNGTDKFKLLGNFAIYNKSLQTNSNNMYFYLIFTYS